MNTTSPSPNDLPELRESAHDFVGYRYDPGYSMSPHDPSALTMRASMRDCGTPKTFPITRSSGEDMNSINDINFTDEALATLAVMHGQIKGVDRKLTKLVHQLGLDDDLFSVKMEEEKAEVKHYERSLRHLSQTEQAFKQQAQQQQRRMENAANAKIAPYSHLQGSLDMPPVMVVLCGLPGAGKSSFCYELDPSKVRQDCDVVKL